MERLLHLVPIVIRYMNKVTPPEVYAANIQQLELVFTTEHKAPKLPEFVSVPTTLPTGSQYPTK
jgi:hypothetical protein